MSGSERNFQPASSSGFDAARLARLARSIEGDIDEQKYDGAALLLSRGGQRVFGEAFGYADRAKERRLKIDDVFFTFSIAKQFTHTLALNRVERGELSLTGRVADIIPEFACRGKENVTLFHLLTHTGGLTLKLPPMDPMQLGDLDAVVAAACRSAVESVPGERVYYSGIIGTAIMAEMIRRAEGSKRRYRDILAQDLFQPLGMVDTALGLRPDLVARSCPVIARDRRPGISEAEEYEGFAAMVGPEAEIPSLGCVTTASDLDRYANMLRGGGALGGTRILSPAMIELATRNHTGTMANDTWSFAVAARGWEPIPAVLGLGFYLRGEGVHPTFLGTLASPGSFGAMGAGSTLFWVDPARDLTCVFLSTGLIVDEVRNVERMQRISDMVLAAVV